MLAFTTLLSTRLSATAPLALTRPALRASDCAPYLLVCPALTDSELAISFLLAPTELPINASTFDFPMVTDLEPAPASRPPLPATEWARLASSPTADTTTSPIGTYASALVPACAPLAPLPKVAAVVVSEVASESARPTAKPPTATPVA